jgi:ABC-2 type transport system permease protein
VIGIKRPSPGAALRWLDGLAALTTRELKASFSSPVAWVVMTVYLALNGILFFSLIEHYTKATAPPVAGSYHLFQFSMFLITFLCPALSMPLFAAEKQRGTLESLLTAPVTEAQVVLAKFLGVLCFYLTMLASSAAYLVALGVSGNWEPGPLAASLLGLCLIGALFLAFGALCSALTRSQLVAFIGGFGFDLALVYGVGLLERYLEPSWALELTRHIGAQRHFQELCRGVVKSPTLAFYLSAVLLLLFLTTRSLQSRSWR